MQHHHQIKISSRPFITLADEKILAKLTTLPSVLCIQHLLANVSMLTHIAKMSNRWIADDTVSARWWAGSDFCIEKQHLCGVYGCDGKKHKSYSQVPKSGDKGEKFKKLTEKWI